MGIDLKSVAPSVVEKLAALSPAETPTTHPDESADEDAAVSSLVTLDSLRTPRS